MKKSKGLLLVITALVVATIVMSCGSLPDARPYSPNFNDGKFTNPIPRGNENSGLDFLKVMTSEDWGVWPEQIKNTASPTLYQVGEQSLVLTFINHATFLLEVNGVRVLFDPMFSDKAGYAGKVGIKRRRPPALSLEQLPPIDYVLISHNHYDHLDLPALQFLETRDSPKVLVPVGDKNWLLKSGLKQVFEFDWWAEYAVNSCMQFSYVPAQHSSGRGLFDREESLWGAWVVEANGFTLFHAGDTGYSPHFSEIGGRFEVDLALLPIGAWKPEWFLNYVHLNPEQALQAHADLGATQSIGMHYDTFPLTALDYGEAAAVLEQQKSAMGFSEEKFVAGEVGRTWRYSPPRGCEI